MDFPVRCRRSGVRPQVGRSRLGAATAASGLEDEHDRPDHRQADRKRGADPHPVDRGHTARGCVVGVEASGEIFLAAAGVARGGVGDPRLLGIPKEDRDRYPNLKKLLALEAGRARRYFDESRPLLDLVHPGSRRSLCALINIYSTLLDRIVQSGYDVMSRRIRLSSVEKAGIVLRAMFS